MSAQSSFKVYRERIHASQLPSLPYLGVYLSDLVFIDEGNPDTIEGNATSSLINFDKHILVSNVILEMQKYQHTTYHIGHEGDDDVGFEVNEEIAAFIADLRGFDDDAAYKKSLISEPRVRAGSQQISPSFLQRLRNSSPSGTL
jgi:RasGEF domain